MEKKNNQVLVTARLALRQLTTADAHFVLRLLNTPGWLQYIGDRGIRTPEAAETYILAGPVKSYADNGFGLWVVQEKDAGTPLGLCGLLKRDDLEDIDIGFAFFPENGGKGYAAEAAQATLAYARETLGITRLVAIVLEDNAPSIRLLRKLGMQEEKKILLNAEELLLFGVELLPGPAHG